MVEDLDESKKRKYAVSLENGPANGVQRPLGPWEVSANDVLSLKLVRTGREAEAFHPAFTYPVFGMEEIIYGYRNLKIELHHAEGSLFTYLGIDYKQKVGKDVSAVFGSHTKPADDIVALLNEKIPAGYTRDRGQFLGRVKLDETGFRPMGKKVAEYALGEEGVVYEVYKCNFLTPGFTEYHRKLQVFLLWFIEGASFLEEGDDRWEMLLLFRKQTSVENTAAYAIVGYMTYYHFFKYSPESCDRRRIRISQFLILPPFQRKGHGARLYGLAWRMFQTDENIEEITVEDPSQEFSDLRDRCDFANLRRENVFLLLGSSVPLASVKATGKKFKLTHQQVQRCIEMFQLQQLTSGDKQAMAEYRKRVKRRIYRANREALTEMERPERVARLAETYLSVEQDYRRLLEKITDDLDTTTIN